MFDKQKFQKSLIKISNWFETPFAVPVVLLLIAFASYGLLINRLGYYWDDFPLVYIKNVFGTAGIERYFSTNRPIWGLLYQVSFNLFNQPWKWQLNALLWRWLSAVILWLLIREIWPDQRKIALWTSLLFLVYPGFKQQHISIIYGNLFFVLDCYLFSLYLNIKVLRNQSRWSQSRKRWLWSSVAWLLSLYNMLAMEYFFALELLRPLLLWTALRCEKIKHQEKKVRLLLNWLPFLVLWLGVLIWRMFFFSFQTHNYEILFFKSFKESPIQALITLVRDIISSFWVVFINTWTHIFKPPVISQLGLRTTIVTIIIILLFTVLITLILSQDREKTFDRSKAKSVLLVGFVACLLGGVPWWLTELPPSLTFPSDRFTLPFILGVSLFLVGLLMAIPLRAWMRSMILGILIGFAVGSQFQVVNQFRRDWETQRRFFWQLAWRIPELDHGTTLMVNDLPVIYYSDNSLTAPLNWFWAPDNNTQEMSYLLFYPSQRLGRSLISLDPGNPISVDYLATKFEGNTSKVVSIYYEPPACLRVLDKSLDSDNRMLPEGMQVAAALSSTELIQPIDISPEEILPEDLYSPEPPHGWCYYFELADLARQQQKWQNVAALGDLAYELNDYPNDPSEHFVFIEGYAHMGNWQRASELSDLSQSVLASMEPLLCRLWQRIEVTTSNSQEKETILTSEYSKLNCSQ